MVSIDRRGENHPMFGRTHSVETLEKISANLGTAIFVYCSKELTLINSFSSANKASKHFKVSCPTILKYVKSGELFQEKWILSTTTKK
jgi:group I intron endonuclease